MMIMITVLDLSTYMWNLKLKVFLLIYCVIYRIVVIFVNFNIHHQYICTKYRLSFMNKRTDMRNTSNILLETISPWWSRVISFNAVMTWHRTMPCAEASLTFLETTSSVTVIQNPCCAMYSLVSIHPLLLSVLLPVDHWIFTWFNEILQPGRGSAFFNYFIGAHRWFTTIHCDSRSLIRHDPTYGPLSRNK